MRPSPAVLVALAAALPGCLLDAHCGPSYDELRWTEPGLYASIQGIEPAWAEWSPGLGALPWNGSSLADGMPWPGVRLSSVGYDVPRPPVQSWGIVADVPPPNIESVAIERDGWLSVATVGDPPPAELRAALDAVLENATEGLDAEAAWRELLASKEDTGIRTAFPTDANTTSFTEHIRWGYAVDLRGHLRLDALAERVGLQPPTEWGLFGGGSSAGGWSFSFSLPVWTVHGDPGRLRVDAADNALYDEASFGDVDRLRAAAEATLARLGRDADLSGVDASGSVC